MSQFEWLLTVAAYLLVAGIVFSTVLFVVYQRRRPASGAEGDTTGDLANMMILLQTMRDMLEEQKTLARQFNQNFEQKLAYMEEKNRAARQRADELEQRAAKLEGRLQRVREELAVLHGEIEAASHGAAQERKPGPLTFSQAGGAAGSTASASDSSRASQSSSGPNADDVREAAERPVQPTAGELEEYRRDRPEEDAAGQGGEAPDPDAGRQETFRTAERAVEFTSGSHERREDEAAPRPGDAPEAEEPPKQAGHAQAEAVEPPRGRMPWDWRQTKSQDPAPDEDAHETPIKSVEAPADSSSNDDAAPADEDKFPPRERPALHILASPDGEDDKEEPEESDAPGYWAGLDFISPPPGVYFPQKAPGQKPPEPGDPEAARQAFRALLNLGQERGLEAASRTGTLDQPSGEDGAEGPLRSRVYEYSDAGMSIAEIASELGIGKGEVRLILSLREQGGR